MKILTDILACIFAILSMIFGVIGTAVIVITVMDLITSWWM